MLKMSKRTLSLVLALIMICSTMGVMTFAAESEREFTRTISFRAPIYNANGYARYTDVSVVLSGGYSVTPDLYGWFNAPRVPYIPDDGEFLYTHRFSNNYATIYIDIKYRYEDSITGVIGVKNSYCLEASITLDGTGARTIRGKICDASGNPSGNWIYF